MNTKTTYKRIISFLDADRKKATIEVEVTTRNGYLEFTASGEYCGSAGQCLDSIKPATPEQKKLIDTWEQWHLNGMSAGTDKQNEIAKGLSYDDAVKKLEESGLLYDTHPETGEPYRYGSGWIKKELPENFIDDLDCLLDEIEAQEEQKKVIQGYANAKNQAQQKWNNARPCKTHPYLTKKDVMPHNTKLGKWSYKDEDGTHRMLVTDTAESPLAKDRSGKLDAYEKADLSVIINKIIQE
jgi:hypothetical protein